METRVTPMRRLAQAAASQSLGQSLEDYVNSRRSAGASWRVIAQEIRDKTAHQVDVTGEALRQWFGARASA